MIDDLPDNRVYNTLLLGLLSSLLVNGNTDLLVLKIVVCPMSDDLIDIVDLAETLSSNDSSYVDVVAQLLNSYHCVPRCIGKSVLTAPWGIQSPGSNTARNVILKYFAVISGSFYFWNETMSEDLQLHAGDIFLFKNDCTNIVRDDPSTTPVSVRSLLTHEFIDSQDGVQIHGGGKESQVFAGIFIFKQAESCQLLNLLSHQILLRGKNGKIPEAIRHSLDQIDVEIVNKAPGWRNLTGHLAKIFLIQFMRHHFAKQSKSPDGVWMNILDDPAISAALKLMHRQPQNNWTVQSLADAVGMSRSAFAARFHSLVGQTPMVYLLQIRMHFACTMLREEKMGIKLIASKLAYASEASFSTAFKRWAGQSPGQFRKSEDLPDQLKPETFLRILKEN